MPLPTAMPPLPGRLGGLAVDRAPLRRAGVLAALLVLLLVAGKAFGPSRAAASAPPDRQDLRSAAEPLSATPAGPTGGWTVGRMAAVGLLVAGVGAAVALRRRRETTAVRRSRLDVIESRPLGSGHSLQLVGCGEEVLLLSVGPEGARMLRHWPRAAVDGEAAPPFADLLAQAEGTVEDAAPCAQAEADDGAPRTGREPTGAPVRQPVDAPASAPAAVESAPERVAAPYTARTSSARGVLFPIPSAPARGLHQFGGRADA